MSTICRQLKLESVDGKKYETDCASYEILTAEISKATFGVTPSEYKDLKELKRENLRDHMDDFELIFTMLGERSTTEIHRIDNSKGVPKLKKDAKRGGKIAGTARNALEHEIGRSVVSKENYLPKKRGGKRIKGFGGKLFLFKFNVIEFDWFKQQVFFLPGEKN
ncbi:MAG: hypothetical protein WCT46_01545 [Candidatus Gracilibacteria bacterium]